MKKKRQCIYDKVIKMFMFRLRDDKAGLRNLNVSMKKIYTHLSLNFFTNFSW